MRRVESARLTVSSQLQEISPRIETSYLILCVGSILPVLPAHALRNCCSEYDLPSVLQSWIDSMPLLPAPDDGWVYNAPP